MSQAIKVVILAPLLFFLPGFTAVRLLELRKRGDLLFEEVLVLSVGLSVGFVAVAALLLAQAGQFSTSKLSIFVLGVTVPLLAVTLSGKRRPFSQRGGLTTTARIFLLFFVVLVLAISFTQGKGIYTGRETSPALMWGASILRTHGLSLFDPGVRELTTEQAETLYGDIDGGAGGVRIEDLADGYVEFDSLALFPAFLAAASGLFSVQGAIVVLGPLLGLLTLLTVLLIARRLLGGLTAATAGVLTAVASIFLYFGRYNVDELFTALLVFLGIACFSLYAESGNGLWGTVSAIVLCLAFLAGFEMYGLLVPIALGGAFVAVREELRGGRAAYSLWFLLPVPVLFLYSLGTGYFFSRGYYLDRYHAVSHLLVPVAAAIGLAAVALIAFVLTLNRWKRIKAWAHGGRIETAVRYALALALVTPAVLAFFWLPRVGMPPQPTYGTFRVVFEMMTQLGFWLFLAGLVIFVVSDLRPAGVMLLLVGITSLAFLASSGQPGMALAWNSLPYMAISVLFAYLMISLALVRVPRLIRRDWVFVVSAAAAAAILMVCPLYPADMLNRARIEAPIEKFEWLVDEFRDRPAPVFLFAGSPFDEGLPGIIRYVLGLEAFPCHADSTDQAVLGTLVGEWTEDGYDVFLKEPAPTPLPILWPGSWATWGNIRPTGFLMQSWLHDPDVTDISIFESESMDTFSLIDGVPADGYHIQVDGHVDSQFLVYGFHDLETADGNPSRWTGDSAGIALPNLTGHERMIISLSMAMGGRKFEVSEVPVLVSIDGKQAAVVDVSSQGFASYQVVVDQGDLAVPYGPGIRLELTMPGWVPAQNGQGPDYRTLGVKFEGFSVSPAPGS